MKVEQGRIKQGGRDCGSDVREMSLPEVINLIVDTELNWGGKVTDTGDLIRIETKVFGDTDRTIIIGHPDDMAILRACIKAHEEGRTKGVIQYLFKQMKFRYQEHYNYSFDDTCIVYGFWLTGDKEPGLIELIRKKRIEPKPPLTQEKIDEAIALRKKLKLDNDDGVNLVIAKTLV